MHSQWGVVFVVLCGGINRTVSSGGGGFLTVVAEHEKEEVQLKISRLIFLLPPSFNSIQFPPSSTSRSCSHGGTHSLTHCSTRDGSGALPSIVDRTRGSHTHRAMTTLILVNVIISMAIQGPDLLLLFVGNYGI